MWPLITKQAGEYGISSTLIRGRQSNPYYRGTVKPYCMGGRVTLITWVAGLPLLQGPEVTRPYYRGVGVILNTGEATLTTGGVTLITGGVTLITGGVILITGRVTIITGEEILITGVILITGGVTLITGGVALITGGVTLISGVTLSKKKSLL